LQAQDDLCARPRRYSSKLESVFKNNMVIDNFENVNIYYHRQ